MSMTEWKDRAGRAYPRLQAEGQDLSEAFREAAREFIGSFTDLSTVRPLDRVVVFCESSDSDWLFSDWINTLVYEIRERRMLFSEFCIGVDGINVKGEMLGEAIDPSRHPLRLDRIAGAAFDELFAHEHSVDQPARVSAVLNDFVRHPLPLRELWNEK